VRSLGSTTAAPSFRTIRAGPLSPWPYLLFEPSHPVIDLPDMAIHVLAELVYLPLQFLQVRRYTWVHW